MRVCKDQAVAECEFLVSYPDDCCDSSTDISGPAQGIQLALDTHIDMHNGKEDTPVIAAEPRVALCDEPIAIKLHNFQRNEKITLHGQYVQGGRRLVFASCGHFMTDEYGHVDVTQQPSTGGTYTGVEPMGMLWSLQAAPGQPQDLRVFVKSTDRPSLIHLKAYPGHILLKDVYRSRMDVDVLAEVELERWVRFPSDVSAQEVHVGNVRGTLFLPSGDGPFQGIIDMFGSTGGNIEYRAALLASRGFAALSLAYFKYQDLPSEPNEVPFDYFEEAVHWFSAHPKVFPYGIGVVAISKSVQFSHCMSAYLDKVKCVVSLSGLPYITGADLYYKGKILQKGSKENLSNAELSHDGKTVLWHIRPFKNNLIPAWQSGAKHLMIVPGDDGIDHPDTHKLLLNACPEEKKHNFEVIKYPGAGHLLDPPYLPLCRSCHSPYYKIILLFGGQMKEHAHAQEDAWTRVLNHLRKYIPSS